MYSPWKFQFVQKGKYLFATVRCHSSQGELSEPFQYRHVLWRCLIIPHLKFSLYCHFRKPALIERQLPWVKYFHSKNVTHYEDKIEFLTIPALTVSWKWSSSFDQPAFLSICTYAAHPKTLNLGLSGVLESSDSCGVLPSGALEIMQFFRFPARLRDSFQNFQGTPESLSIARALSINVQFIYSAMRVDSG